MLRHDMIYLLTAESYVLLTARLVQIFTPNGHLYKVTYTRCRIDTINSPDDWQMVARNM